MADQDTNVHNKTDFISREEMHKANRDEWEGVYGYIDCDIFEDNESMIDRVPAVDVVEVVRCKDCRWWTKQEKSLQGRCELAGFYPTGEWFCANGERSNCGADMREVKADG